MKTTPAQLQLLLEYMEKNGDLSKPTDGPNGKHKNIQYWDQITEILNTDGVGDVKSAEKWRKVWHDLKGNTKKKAARIHRAAVGTGGGPASKLKLTDLEERVLAVMGSHAATGFTKVTEIPPFQEESSLQSASPTRSPSVQPPSEVQEVTESISEVCNRPGSSFQPTRFPLVLGDGSETPSSGNMRIREFTPLSSAGSVRSNTPAVDNTMPMSFARQHVQTPTPVPLTSRQQRVHNNGPYSRRTGAQTQADLARDTYANSDDRWRAVYQETERERTRQTERELDQQDRWLDIFTQFIELGNRVMTYFENK